MTAPAGSSSSRPRRSRAFCVDRSPPRSWAGHTSAAHAPHAEMASPRTDRGIALRGRANAGPDVTRAWDRSPGRPASSWSWRPSFVNAGGPRHRTSVGLELPRGLRLQHASVGRGDDLSRPRPSPESRPRLLTRGRARRVRYLGANRDAGLSYGAPWARSGHPLPRADRGTRLGQLRCPSSVCLCCSLGLVNRTLSLDQHVLRNCSFNQRAHLGCSCTDVYRTEVYEYPGSVRVSCYRGILYLGHSPVLGRPSGSYRVTDR